MSQQSPSEAVPVSFQLQLFPQTRSVVNRLIRFARACACAVQPTTRSSPWPGLALSLFFSRCREVSSRGSDPTGEKGLDIFIFITGLFPLKLPLLGRVVSYTALHFFVLTR